MSEEDKNQDIDPNDPGLKLLKGDDKDMQRLASWVGRIQADSKKKDEMINELKTKLESSSTKKPEFGEDDQAKFNEKLHEMILDGRVMEALTLVNNVHKEAEKQLKAADQKRFDTAIAAIAEDPLMKNEELAASIKQKATSMIKEGVSPSLAVKYARTEVENAILRESGGGAKSLELLGSGGGSAPTQTEKKLPDLAEKEYQKAKAKGYFKDREEFLNYLDPRVREQWGLNA